MSGTLFRQNPCDAVGYEVVSKGRWRTPGRTPGSWLLGVACAMALLELIGLAAWGAESSLPEYRVKAAFLYNFAKFVEWPADSFPDEGSPFIIAVVGEDPFGELLDKAVEGRTVNNRKIALKRFKRVEDMQPCHILFISPSEKPRLSKILGRLGKAHTLTISEMDGFLQRGGMVNFIIEDEKVRFEINPDAAERVDLKISSKVLQLARIVKV